MTLLESLVVPVRHTARVLSYLDGSGPFQGQQYAADSVQEAAARSWVGKVQAAAQRADGSRTAALTLDEARVCYDYGDALVTCGADELSDPDSRADYNAGRALCRNLLANYGQAVADWT